MSLIVNFKAIRHLIQKSAGERNNDTQQFERQR